VDENHLREFTDNWLKNKILRVGSFLLLLQLFATFTTSGRRVGSYVKKP